MKSSGRLKLEQRTFMEQVHECLDNGYLLSSKKIGSGAFSKVYLAYATQERMKHNPKLSSDLRNKHHTMVAIKIVSMAKAPEEFSQKFLPRESSSLNATYKHVNVVQLYETYQNSQRSYLVLELAARGDLLEHINTVSDQRCCPGLEEEEARRLFWQWQLVSAVAHCHNVGIVHRDLKCENILLEDQGFLKLTDFGFANCTGLKNSLLSTFCRSVAYTAPEILMSKKYNGKQADLWSLSIILHAMVSGKLPFKEHQPHRMLHLMRRGPIFKPGLSPECRDLIRGLLQLHPHARLGLQQVAAHHWMLPAAQELFSVLGAVPEPQAGSQDNTESGTDSMYPCTRTPCIHVQQLQSLQQSKTPKESTSGLALRPLEACPRQGASSACQALRSTMAVSPLVCATRQPLSLCSTLTIRNMPGHYLAN
ncbi:LOW QUALITY PROTEIN: testis-specific serine/threonine-protein kinase 5-like [Castor canadensis]|uniref:non-specific serine/threonine protein kinase n=1 Tax=Castor canadensis TaxID=51338 RepID=A0A8B7V3W4_CASCN